MASVINVTVQNIGRQTIDSGHCTFYADHNRSMYPDTLELLTSVCFDPKNLLGDSSADIRIIAKLAAGEISVVVVAEICGDERKLSNNQARLRSKSVMSRVRLLLMK